MRIFDTNTPTLQPKEAAYLQGVDAITRAPMPLASQHLVLSFLAIVVLALAWAVFSHIDIVSIAQGKSISSSRIQLIQAPQLAVVEVIYVKEGDHVEKGQLLVNLDKKQQDSTHHDAQLSVWQLEAKKRRIIALLNATQQQLKPDYGQPIDSAEQKLERALMQDGWAMYQSELGSMHNQQENRAAAVQRIQASINRLNKLIPFSKKTYQNKRQLHKKGGISRTELDESQEALIERESALLVSASQLNEAKAALSQSQHELDAYSERFINNLSVELLETEQLLGNAKGAQTRASLEVAQLQLYAPVTGTVKDITVNTPGGVVEAADVLMQIVPEDVPLEVEAKILNRDIGFVKEGQKVEVKVDTFNFTKYGAISGTIKHLAQDATEDKKLGAVYRALIVLDKDTIKIGERAVKLVPGMTMTVDIHVGQRRLIEYILNPVLRYQNEVMRERWW